jgi:hypothetical protein
MKVDWPHFERKLASGKTLDEAAVEMGLSPDLIRDRYNDHKHATSAYSLEAVSCKAMAAALETLTRIMAEGSEMNQVNAAGHLLKFATAAMKSATDKRSLAVAKNNSQGMVDLFDAVGDWVLKKPGV